MTAKYETWSLEALRQEARIRSLSCPFKSNDEAERQALIVLLKPLKIKGVRSLTNDY